MNYYLQNQTFIVKYLLSTAQENHASERKKKKKALAESNYTPRYLENEFTNLALNLKLKAQTNPCLPDATQASGNNKNRQKYCFWSRNYSCKMNRKHCGMYTHAEKHSQCFNKARHNRLSLCSLPYLLFSPLRNIQRTAKVKEGINFKKQLLHETTTNKKGYQAW